MKTAYSFHATQFFTAGAKDRLWGAGQYVIREINGSFKICTGTIVSSI